MESSGPTVAPAPKCAFCRVRWHSWTRDSPGKNRCSDRTAPWAVLVQSDKVAADAFVQFLKFSLLSPRCVSKAQQVSNWREQSQFLCDNFATIREPPLFRGARDE